jgi:hypothetical protein
LQFKRFLIVITLCLGSQAHASTHLILIGGGKSPTEAMDAFVKAACSDQNKLMKTALGKSKPLIPLD